MNLLLSFLRHVRPIILIAAALSFANSAKAANTWYVNPGSTGIQDGTDWSKGFHTLEQALVNPQLAAQDQIWVLEGTYRPMNLVWGFSITEPIKLYGGFKVDEPLGNRTGVTILDGDPQTPAVPFDNAKHVVSISTPSAGAVLIDGFTIQNGTGITSDGNGQTDGGGVWAFCANLTLSSCIVKNNSAEKGGGLWMKGGCFYDSGPLVPDGNATQLEPPSRRLWVKNCEFDQNLADSLGGGIYGEIIRGDVVSTTFRFNEAGQGGGAYLGTMRAGEQLVFANCVYRANICQSFGAGLRLDDDTVAGASGSVVNCTFASNQASNGNGGQAISVSGMSTATIYNAILYFNGFTGDAQIHAATGSSVTVAYSDIESWGSGGTSNFSVDPFFRNVSTGNLRLRNDTSVSPCIDRANYGTALLGYVLPLDVTDVDGDGVTSERINVDLDLGSRTIDITTVTDAGAGDITYLDLGAYERGG